MGRVKFREYLYPMLVQSLLLWFGCKSVGGEAWLYDRSQLFDGWPSADMKLLFLFNIGYYAWNLLTSMLTHRHIHNLRTRHWHLTSGTHTDVRIVVFGAYHQEPRILWMDSSCSWSLPYGLPLHDVHDYMLLGYGVHAAYLVSIAWLSTHETDTKTLDIIWQWSSWAHIATHSYSTQL